jgi:2-iminobutanoate/2-iminopropanoate deaminase
MPKSIPETPSAGPSFGPYSPAVEANGFIFLAGQIGVDSDGNLVGDVAAQTRQAMENIGALLHDVGLNYADIVKATIFLADLEDFGTMNDVYGGFFEHGPPARSAFQVARLPRDAAVEIEVVASL